MDCVLGGPLTIFAVGLKEHRDDLDGLPHDLDCTNNGEGNHRANYTSTITGFRSTHLT